MKKVQLRKSDGIEQAYLPNIPKQEEEDECDELLENNARDTIEKSISVKNRPSFIHSMNIDELNDHFQKCLEMNNENKITLKNAFALQLIDCMDIALQKKDFSTMACTLDAGAKIYSFRVDALHRQVMQLANEIGPYKKEKRRDEKEEGEDSLSKEKRKVKKKNTISVSETLRRTLKRKDPRAKYIKLDGFPGAIMSSCRRDHTNLSLSLENNLPFWNYWKDYKPTEAEGTVTLPEYKIIRNHAKEPRNSETTQGNLSKLMSILNNHKQETHEQSQESQQSLTLDGSISDCDYENKFEELVNTPDKKKLRGEEVDIIATALERLNEGESSSRPVSRFEAMKLIFNNASDYSYLNVKNVHLWAGPEFWKRPKGAVLNNKENKITKKSKPPKVIHYEENEKSAMGKKNFLKKNTVLSKRTITGWKRYKLTLPDDLKLEPEDLLDLFQISLSARLTESVNHSISLNQEASSNSIHVDENLSSSQDTLNNSFYDPSNSSTIENKDVLNSAFFDAGLLQRPNTSHGLINGIGTTKVIKVVEVDSNNTPPIDKASPIIVPKRTTTGPIKYSSKPKCIDMQHLKQTMLAIIQEEVEENELEKRVWADRTPPEVSFRNVLKKLPAKLERRTKDDLSPAIALMALLTLANENNLHLQNCEGSNDITVRM